jgi:hypothetical protein
MRRHLKQLSNRKIVCAALTDHAEEGLYHDYALSCRCARLKECCHLRPQEVTFETQA